jgi:hypothetical protein
VFEGEDISDGSFSAGGVNISGGGFSAGNISDGIFSAGGEDISG